MMYRLYIVPAEGICTIRDDGRVCSETSFAEGSRSLTDVSGTDSNSIRECIRANPDVDVQTGCTCTLSSSSLLLQTTTNQGRKEDKATANRVGLGPSYRPGGNKSFPAVSC